jgi:hypothetical protein
MQIKALLLELLNGEMISPLLCKVDEVNGMTCNVTPVNGEATVLDVRLIANADADKYFALVPKVGSHVVVMFLTKAVAFIAMVDEVDKVVCKIGDVVFDIDATGFLLKKQNEDLKTLLGDMITAITTSVFITPSGNTTGMLPGSITALNNIKTRFNSLLKS